MTREKVLDKGFVDLQEVFGDETTVVNSARVSFGKQKEVLGDDDIRLMRYLLKHKHMSPFRHLMFRFHIKAPEFVMRQWYKHVIGAEWTSSFGANFHAWNEISGRYVQMEEVYFPTEWRQQSMSSKQASDGLVQGQDECKQLYEETIQKCMETYQTLLDKGVAREQARLVLPFSLYTEAIWTCSFQAVMNFLELRLDQHAQWEIQEYARKIHQAVKQKLPVLTQCWEDVFAPSDKNVSCTS